MKFLQQLSGVILTLTLAISVGVGAWWLVVSKPPSTKAEKPPPAAKVPKTVKEDDLNIITLTDEAEKRIGLEIGMVKKKKLRRTRVYGGEAMVPLGKTVVVSAPVAGVLKQEPGDFPKIGYSVVAGRKMFQLSPLLTPDGRVTLSASLADAEGQVQSAKAQLEVAKIAFDRAKRVLSEGAGSQRQVDEAQGAFDVGGKLLAAAAARKSNLAKFVGDLESGTAAPFSLEVPQPGVLRNVFVSSGQTVAAGAPLFEVVDFSTLWIRVAIPMADFDDLAPGEPASLARLSDPLAKPFAEVNPVTAPPSANAAASTVDRFFELANDQTKLSPGERLSVSLTRKDSKESRTMPWSAIVFDAHGGTWCYESLGEQRFVRKRVQVHHTVGADAVFTAGPVEGTKVVAAGVEQIFGAETGFVK